MDPGQAGGQSLSARTRDSGWLDLPLSFRLERLRHRRAPEGIFGIKWHRHDNEPVYHYADPRCERIIQEITKRRLPIVLEESFANTCRFVEKLAPEAVIIIPHLGALNGSYPAVTSPSGFTKMSCRKSKLWTSPVRTLTRSLVVTFWGCWATSKNDGISGEPREDDLAPVKADGTHTRLAPQAILKALII